MSLERKQKIQEIYSQTLQQGRWARDAFVIQMLKVDPTYHRATLETLWNEINLKERQAKTRLIWWHK